MILTCVEDWCPGTHSPLTLLSTVKTQRKRERYVERGFIHSGVRQGEEDPEGSMHKDNGGTCVPALSGTGLSTGKSHLPTSASRLTSERHTPATRAHRAERLTLLLLLNS